MTADMRDEMRRLLSAVCDSEASPENHHRLEELLWTDPQCRKLYLWYLDIHATFRTHALLGGAAVGSSPAGVSRPTRRKPGRAVAWAVGLAGIAAAWIAVVSRPPATPPTPESVVQSPQLSDYVATLTAGSGCVWGSPLHELRSGNRLTTDRYVLNEGVAEVRLEGGAVLIFQGPSTFQLDDRRGVKLTAGRFALRTDETSTTVRVSTPRGVYLNMGTQYVIAAKSDCDELQVIEGHVRRSSLDGSDGTAEVTSAGTARRYIDDASPGTAIPFDASVPRVVPDVADGNQGLLAYEGFSSKEGNDLELSGGRGWSADWIFHQWAPALRQDAGRLDAGPNLPWPGVPGDDPGGSIHHSGRMSAMHRYLAEPVHMDRDATYFVSFRCRRAASTPGDRNQIMVVLRKWGLTTEQEILGRTSLKFSVANSDAVAAVQFDGVNTRAPQMLAPDTTYLFVGKIHACKTRPDQVFLRVYRPEDPPGDEPSDWSIVSPVAQSDAVFDQVSLEFISKADTWLDELRIGRTWASVTQPTPPARVP